MSQDIQDQAQKPYRLKAIKDSHLFFLMSGLVVAILASVLAMGQVWQDGHQALQGNYEAAEVVDLGNNKYRMFYDTTDQPQSGIYSAISSDAIHWKQEEGVRKDSADWPSVTKLSDGRWRMYFHNGNGIRSAISPDGLNWTDEPGVRMDTDSQNLSLDDVSEPAVRQLDDGTYLMVYTGISNQKYGGSPKSVDKTSLFMWASSRDGLSFDKKGIAIDSRNDTFRGQINGPEIVKWTDGTVHLFFWGSKGIYDAALKNNNSFIDPRLAFAKNLNGQTGSPPADPTLLKVGNKWFMYYQEHNRGIYYATLGG